jgi:hypothetical protein
LFAAFSIADGALISELHRRHRATEFRKFLAAIDKAVPAGLDVHLACDNTPRNTPEIRTWLARRRDPELPGRLSRQARAGQPGKQAGLINET